MRGRVGGNTRLGEPAKHHHSIAPPAAQGLGSREQIHQIWIVRSARLHRTPRQVVEGLVRAPRSSLQREFAAPLSFLAINRCALGDDDG